MSETNDPQLSDEQIATLRRLKSFYPYRIVYGAVDPRSGEFESSAVKTMHRPNKLMRDGWRVYQLQALSSEVKQ